MLKNVCYDQLTDPKPSPAEIQLSPWLYQTLYGFVSDWGHLHNIGSGIMMALLVFSPASSYVRTYDCFGVKGLLSFKYILS